MADGVEESMQPVWARREAFPEAGEGYGWVDRKGRKYVCPSLEQLGTTIRGDKDSAVNLVWTPDSKFCVVPEEVEVLAEPIREVRKRWAEDDMAEANLRVKRFGIILAALLGYMVFQAWRQFGASDLLLILGAVMRSTTVGFALLGFLIFAFIPWYQVRKRVKEMTKVGGNSEPVIPLIRFETWLDMQKAPLTWGLLGVMSVVALLQMWFDGAVVSFGGSVGAAGLVKPLYFSGEWWRLFTAPMLHGGIVHFVMNAMALLYLGKRVEVFARWPHVPMVFLFSSLVGGEASARFTEATSVGASGGLMGWLGFLLVFETLHSNLVPRSAKRRLVGGVVITALIGLVGYRFIDNAAHFGGLVAGMAYAGIVFPKSGSVIRPRVMPADRVIGGATLVVIAASAVYAVGKMGG